MKHFQLQRLYCLLQYITNDEVDRLCGIFYKLQTEENDMFLPFYEMMK